MEKLKAELLTKFLGLGDGCGYGDGYGDGYGCGSGDGCGSGYDSGYGDGYGDGYGWSIKSINFHDIYKIDSIPTILINIRKKGELFMAKGFIVNRDLTFKPCYIAKQNNLFAHGETLEDAISQLQDKLFEDMPVEERIAMFLQEFNLNDKYPATMFFDWHNKLTGSCLMGRESFVKNNGIDMSKEYTVKDFIAYCENDYGRDVIGQLKQKINKVKGE